MKTTLATIVMLLVVIAYNTAPPLPDMALRQTQFVPAKWLQRSEVPSIFYAMGPRHCCAISSSHEVWELA